MKSFPFDSEVTYTDAGEPIYDRAYNSEELRRYLQMLFYDGIPANPSNCFLVTAYSETMSVAVMPGEIFIQGALGREDSQRVLVFEAADATYDRIDAVVARLNTNYEYRNIDFYIVKGTAAEVPVAPALTREGGIYELRLANVFIAKSTTTISTERITDTRMNDEDCGILTCKPFFIDTTYIFKQYQAALDTFLEESEDWRKEQELLFYKYVSNIYEKLGEDENGELVANMASTEIKLEILDENISELRSRVSELEKSVPVTTTQTQYNALSSEEKNNGRLYIIAEG